MTHDPHLATLAAAAAEVTAASAALAEVRAAVAVERRWRRRTTALLSLALAGVVVLGVLAWRDVAAEREADCRRRNAIRSELAGAVLRLRPDATPEDRAALGRALAPSQCP